MKTDDLRIVKTHPLLAPAILAEEIPLTEAASGKVYESRRAIEAILDGKDARLLVIVGPCSIHDTRAALEYATKLRAIADALADALLIVMRVYFEKPRTVVGWKGLINDPDLDESYHINKGLRLARQLLADILDLGVAAGTEFLDTTFGQFYTDVPKGHPFYEWIMRLTNLGIMSGYPCGGPGEPCDDQNRPYFRPFNNVTRGQASKIVANTFYPDCQTP